MVATILGYRDSGVVKAIIVVSVSEFERNNLASYGTLQFVESHSLRGQYEQLLPVANKRISGTTNSQLNSPIYQNYRWS